MNHSNKTLALIHLLGLLIIIGIEIIVLWTPFFLGKSICNWTRLHKNGCGLSEQCKPLWECGEGEAAASESVRGVSRGDSGRRRNWGWERVVLGEGSLSRNTEDSKDGIYTDLAEVWDPGGSWKWHRIKDQSRFLGSWVPSEGTRAPFPRA